MDCNRAGRAAGLICVLLLTVTADNSVHIRSKYGQLVTSSTLSWVPMAHVENYKDFVMGGFIVSQITEGDPASNQAEQPSVHEKPVFVCRALHNGVWVSGGLVSGEKHCLVSLLGVVHSYERCELLLNVDNGARLGWVHWDKYVPLMVGAVASEKTYVARHKVRNDDSDPNEKILGFTHYIGNFDPNDGLGSITYVKEDRTQASADSGEILVETEPIYYELTTVKFDHLRKRDIKRVPVVLGEATLSNTRSEATEVAEAFGYSYNYSMYWGQGRAMLKGLNASVVLVNNTRLPDIVWGIEEKGKRENVHTVEIFLEPGTAVNVTLRANYSDMEVPYTGKVVSHYEDKTIKTRLITGTRREESMIDVRPEFGPIYFLNNNTLVPTTVPPTTTLAPTTKAPNIIKESPMEDHNVHPDENMIVPPKKSDTTHMQGDDGGPLSLQNKVENRGTPSGVCPLLFTPSLLFISVLTVTFHRIT